MAILEGKVIARTFQEGLKGQVAELKKDGVTPAIAPILVGDNPGAKVYYHTKERLAEKLGIRFAGIKLPGSTSQEALIGKIHQLNQDSTVHGLFVELPLPKGISLAAISSEIAPQKDIDCINPLNMGRLVVEGAGVSSYAMLNRRSDLLLPATPQAVMELLLDSGVELAGLDVTVIGRSLSVGRPLSLLLLTEGATVTMCHSKTKHLANITQRSEVVCVAVGHPRFLTSEMVTDGVVVIDIGTNVIQGGITGDVDYAGVEKKASLITPVPGGVGPMTTTMIMVNTVKAARNLTKEHS